MRQRLFKWLNKRPQQQAAYLELSRCCRRRGRQTATCSVQRAASEADAMRQNKNPKHHKIDTKTAN